ncbi:hypothetical protein [Caldicellulosiruptor morganii]|uniref:Uncharacterized protein n=1 Tax=Caldicellulosiruptor morganii TaxID=1387555 RepID=A0ABY7BNY2_9FIRM|nr:hypothetical protein [Caldicellulosiruptor morganii]WAM33465.1 hypothetical protein OTK00_001966 [Caldicellulosiruptor morganii]
MPVDGLIFLLVLCTFLTYRQLRTKTIEMDLIKVAKNIFKA